MKISLIAAMAQNRVIGKDGTMPWDIPEEFQLFKDITYGHTIIMGRRTFLSLDGPLPGRRNIVLSKTMEPKDGIEIFTSLERALESSKGDGEVFIIGGEHLYSIGMGLAQKIYLSVIDKEYQGDTFFPEIPKEFTLQKETSYDTTIPFVHKVYVRRET